MEWRPDVIVLGPGGAKGFLEIGCCKKLAESNLLDDVKIWVGISAGAAIALLLVIGYSSNEIEEICMGVDLVDDILSINLSEAKEKLGLIENRTVIKTLSKCVMDKLGFIPSLKELYILNGMTYTAVTYNLDKMRPEFLNWETEPNLSCLEATLMSMTVPGLMQPRKHKGYVYVDGAIGAPYPVLKYDDGTKNVLGIYISSEIDNYSSDKKPTNFLYKLVQAGMSGLRSMSIEYSSDRVKHIPLKTTVKDTTGLSISDETRTDMINQGYQCAETFLTRLENPNKYTISSDEDDDEIPVLNM